MAETKVIMPQMGESIFEGTLTKWLKKVGDQVQRDESLFEISTDKIDSEIPSPAAGTLQEILVQEGQTVQINTVVAVIGDGTKSAAEPPAPSEQKTAPKTAQKPEAPKTEAPKTEDSSAKPTAAPPAKPEAGASPIQETESDPKKPAPAASKAEEAGPAKPAAPAGSAAPAAAKEAGTEGKESEGKEPDEDSGAGHQATSPLVRRIAKEHGVDLAALAGKGTGVNGRITKSDVLSYIEQGGAKQAPPAQGPVQSAATDTPASAPPAVGDMERVPLTAMRKAIAEHMVLSRKTSAHVTTFFEVDCTGILKEREKLKAEFEKSGTHLTVTPFFVRAAARALKKFPIVNSSLDGDTIVYKRAIHIGIAVSLDWGLIVPVIRNVEEKNLLGISRAINDLGDRARNKKLSPDDIRDGTFTITNPGQYGGVSATPIINQPQVAIMGMGGIKKRAVVIDDAIAIRSMIMLALSFDHRVIDGAIADQFMAEVQHQLENWDS